MQGCRTLNQTETFPDVYLIFYYIYISSLYELILYAENWIDIFGQPFFEVATAMSTLCQRSEF